MEPSDIKAMIKLLDDTDPEVLGHIRQKFFQLGSTAIPYLEREWEYAENEELQVQIENLVHELQFQNVVKRFNYWLEKEQDNLLKGMWVIATYTFPDLKFAILNEQIEQLFYSFWVEFRQNMHPLDQIKLLNKLFFTDQKFRANLKDFHSPSNSMINQVLDSKKGNPISLSVLYMLLANKLRLPVYGVNLPNLFIVTYKSAKIQFYVNPFNKGLVFSRMDIDHYLEQLQLKPQVSFYEPCTHLDIIRRVLRNLMLSFERIGQTQNKEEIQELLNMTEPYDSIDGV